MTQDDRIAVVGVATRVPGATDAPAMWRNLRAGVDSVHRLGPDELAAAGVSGQQSWVPAFGRLDELESFDANLFGYSDAEAALLDPQHRLFLEVAWWALEDAGIDPQRSEAQIGVYAGCGPNRYLRHHLLGNPSLRPDAGLAEDWDDLLAGGTSDYLPTRTAYALGLSGPAVAVQTACSSSLVAVCQAAQSLLDYRCDVAVAGGAAVVSTRQAGYRYRPGGTWSQDGVCRPYDAEATGQVFGNGAGAVILRRLDDAIEAGDHIYAVIAGWAVNNDGADRAGFNVPGVTGQAAVVAEALAAGDWDPDSIGFVEGHGSGTPLGDTIEVEALTRAFRNAAGSRPPGRPGGCVLGSAKPNLGNLDAAAGVVGLIKAVYAVGAGVVPPTLHFTKAHPEMDLESTPFAVSATAAEWPESGRPRRAGVSSFGLGGTNAHVLVEQGPSRTASSTVDGDVPLVLSTMDDQALAESARRLAGHLAEHPELSLGDVAHTLATGRRRLPRRAAVAAASVADAVIALRELADGASPGLDELPEHQKQAVTAWLAGGDPPACPGAPVPLPGYPFQRLRHWIDPPQQQR